MSEWVTYGKGCIFCLNSIATVNIQERRTSRRRLMYLGYIMFGSFPTLYKLFEATMEEFRGTAEPENSESPENLEKA